MTLWEIVGIGDTISNSRMPMGPAGFEKRGKKKKKGSDFVYLSDRYEKLALLDVGRTLVEAGQESSRRANGCIRGRLMASKYTRGHEHWATHTVKSLFPELTILLKIE